MLGFPITIKYIRLKEENLAIFKSDYYFFPRMYSALSSKRFWDIIQLFFLIIEPPQLCILAFALLDTGN